MKNLLIQELLDHYLRENFQRIQNWYNSVFSPDGSPAILSGIKWETFDITISQPVTNYDIIHSIGNVPTDLLLTWENWDSTVGTITWHYGDFTDKKVVVSISQPGTFRGYIGRRQ